MSITDLVVLREGACEYVRPDVPMAAGSGSAAARELLHIDPKEAEL